MDSRSIATVAGTALVTATLALIPFRASFVNATADEGIVFPLGQPTVVFDGVEVSLTCVDARRCIEGNEPSIGSISGRLLEELQVSGIQAD